MKTNFNCEICGECDWYELGKRAYQKSDALDESSYLQKRFRVLFDVWFPGESEIELTSLGCRQCGFVCYSPRPETKDIDSKYHALAKMGQDYGNAETAANIECRSSRMFHVVRKFLSRQKCSILDYGGGDGRLMHDFSNAGHECFLVDYNEQPYSVVTKLGDTLDSINIEQKFDVIVANHVIEHVSQPMQVISKLGRLLKSGGVLFVEVPLEIWKTPPLQQEPVTHVNFFVKRSLQRAFEEAGLSIKRAVVTTYLHPTDQLLPAIQIFGSRVEGQTANHHSSGWQELMSYLNPRMTTKLKRHWELREQLPEKVKYKLKQLTFRRNSK